MHFLSDSFFKALDTFFQSFLSFFLIFFFIRTADFSFALMHCFLFSQKKRNLKLKE